MEANRKRTKVHRLPTEDASHISQNALGAIFFNRIPKEKQGVFTPQHLYFTTDEEIKEGDWYLDTYTANEITGMRSIFIKIGELVIRQCSNSLPFIGKKIIASTNHKLCIECTYKKDDKCKSLPQPSEAFIKAYCEQGGIDEVDVEYEMKMEWTGRDLNGLRTASPIPTGKLKVDPIHNTITTYRIVEKMYSISDIESYCEKYPNDTELGREIRKLRYKQ